MFWTISFWDFLTIIKIKSSVLKTEKILVLKRELLTFRGTSQKPLYCLWCTCLSKRGMTCKYLVHCRFPRDQIILRSHLPHAALRSCWITLTKWVMSKDGNFCKSSFVSLAESFYYVNYGSSIITSKSSSNNLSNENKH